MKLNHYTVTLKSGIVKQLTREEPKDKNLIGLWVWFCKRKDEIVLDFEEAVILASEVAMIERPATEKTVDTDTVEVTTDLLTTLFTWFSGCSNIELMRQWFSDLDAFELYQNGYKLFKFKSSQYIEEEHQTLFSREGIITKQEIPLDTIWRINKLNKEQINIHD